MKKQKKAETGFYDDKIEMLLSQKSKAGLLIETALSELESPYNILVLAKQAGSFSDILSIVKIVSAEKPLVIYVSVNKPADKVLKELEKSGVAIKNLRFIDMVSVQVGAQKALNKNVSYIGSANSLNELMEELEKTIKEKGFAHKVLLFDSVSTLLVYNETVPVEKLVHSLIGKLNQSGVNGVFLMVKSAEQQNTIQTISQFCDKVVEL